MHILLRLSGSAFVASSLFKILHWPGASMLLLAAWVLAVVYFSAKLATARPITSLALTQWGMLTFGVTGWMFKFMHWPVASLLQLLTVVGVIGFAALGGAAHMAKALEASKQRSSALTLGLFGLATAFTVLGSVFKLQHWPLASVLLLVGGVVWMAWLWAGAFPRRDVRLEVLDAEA
ncbi:MAG: hypothetical protein ACON34_11180 [Flavobacteriales bacterium]